MATTNVARISADYANTTTGEIALLASNFNGFLVESLVHGAIEALKKHGINENKITIIEVPGAFELPVVAKSAIDSGRFTGIVALGAVIRGATAHFDYVAGECASGLAKVSLQSGVPISFGVLTTESIEQTLERSGTTLGNKGYEAAIALLETLSVINKIKG